MELRLAKPFVAQQHAAEIRAVADDAAHGLVDRAQGLLLVPLVGTTDARVPKELLLQHDALVEQRRKGEPDDGDQAALAVREIHALGELPARDGAQHRARLSRLAQLLVLLPNRGELHGAPRLHEDFLGFLHALADTGSRPRLERLLHLSVRAEGYEHAGRANFGEVREPAAEIVQVVAPLRRLPVLVGGEPVPVGGAAGKNLRHHLTLLYHVPVRQLHIEGHPERFFRRRKRR
mmetsp:Transcript_27472/g.69287  ORF Transcript_27472/g.69287 Transcript_27472/m.69287 type:complete len:234 (-) Transcript_27472:1694-2395(-)